MLARELNRLGFNLREGDRGPGNADVERELYPHFLSHAVGIGALTYFLILILILVC